MTPLNEHQKQLLFDYCLGLTNEQDAAEVKALISSDKQAAEIHANLQAALSPLRAVEQPQCPDELTDKLFARLQENSVGEAAQQRLKRLIVHEQTRWATLRFAFLRNFGDVFAVAAVIMVIAAVLVPSLGLARQHYWQDRCQGQMGSIFRGLNSYISDHNGQLPAVPTQAGAPWWKVGYQGNENHSNTRPIWLLVKNNYVRPRDFVCPGIRKVKDVNFDTLQMQNYNDFPSRSYISYSFRIRCSTATGAALQGRKVVMADMNPLAEQLPSDYSASFKIRLGEETLNFNSPNHNRRGQSVLCSDGSVQFIKTRTFGDSQSAGGCLTADDIFAIQGMQCGSEVNGCEVPSCETDAFLAP